LTGGVPGYSVGAILSTAAGVEVTGGERLSDRLPVLLKRSLGPAGPDRRLRREYDLLLTLALAAAPRVVELLQVEGRDVLVLEHTRGRSLRDWLEAGPIPTGEFLERAVQIADALAGMHERRIIHQNLKPENILLTEGAGVILRDFEAAALIPPGRRAIWGGSQGAPEYMAPEQADEIVRGRDQRSDLYALGVIFFEALIGIRPFDDDDPMGLVYAHLSRRPMAMVELNPTLPSPLSALVARLLEKQPLQRYQSASGLAADLRRCRARLDDRGGISDFELGEFDGVTRLEIPEGLYGREAEREHLEESLREAVQERPGMALIVGPAGIGKSALARTLQETIQACGGQFLSGKFEQLGRDTPYLAFQQAFSSLVAGWLTKDEASVQRHRERLGGLGSLLEPLAALVPELKRLFDVQECPEAPEATQDDERARFLLAIRRFVDAVATPAEPLVLFLDDLQWADAASMELVVQLLAERLEPGLMIVGTSRGGEGAGRLPHWIGRLTTAQVPLRAVTLGPVGPAAINQLVADALLSTPERTAGLSALISERTGDKPLFVRQFVLHLEERGLLRFSPGSGWTWRLEEIRGASLPEDVAGVVSAKLHRLAAETRLLLEVASCVGTRFDAGTLGALHSAEVTGEDIEHRLLEAVDEGLLSFCGAEFCFQHDRIQETAGATLSPAERRRIFTALGRLRLSGASEVGLPAAVFGIVDCLNHGELPVNDEERARWMSLNLMAGRRAMGGAANDAALVYLEAGLALAVEGDWEAHRETLFGLHFCRVQALVLGSRSQEGREAAEVLLALSLTDGEYAAVLGHLVMTLNTVDGQAERALRRGLQGLERLGVRLGYKQSAPTVALWILRAQLALMRVDDLLEHPMATDSQSLARTELILALAGPAYLVDANLSVAMGALHLLESLQSGFTASSDEALVKYALLYVGIFKQPERGNALAQKALALSARLHGAPRPRVAFIEATFLRPWVSSLRGVADALEEIWPAALEAGDVEFAGYASARCLYLSYYSGVELALIEERIQSQEKAFGRLVIPDRVCIAALVLRCVQLLSGRASLDAPDPFGLEQYRDSIWDLTELKALITGATVCLVLEEPERALALLESFKGNLEQVAFSSYAMEEYTLNLGLAAAAVHERASGSERRRLRRVVARSLRRLRVHARRGVTHFIYKAALLAAEAERIDGDTASALLGYERAADDAAAEGSVHHEGFILDRKASLLSSLGLKNQAQVTLSRARGCYEQWGALARVAQLDRRLGRQASAPRAPRAGEQMLTTKRRNPALDRVRGVSQELSIDDLLMRIIGVAMENAGAERGVLLLDKGAGLVLVAEQVGRSAQRFADTALARSVSLPGPALHLAARTRKTLLVEDASADPRFREDPCVRQRVLRTLLCAPIVRQGVLTGLIYLEKNQAAHAFTPEQVELLSLLCAQAAISLENARLYSEAAHFNESLESRVKLHTEQLLEAKQLAERATRAKGDFLATMSHEIRTPLNGVLGMAQVLEGTELDPDQRGFVDTIRSSGESLLSIINDILDFSKIEAGRMTLESIPFDLRDCVESAVALMAPKAQSAGLRLLLHVEPDACVSVVGDPVRLRQVVLNLIGNAIKFTRQGHVLIRIARDGERLRFEVADTGVGISESQRAGLFQHFAQADSSTTRRFGGTGLGLAISKRLVQSMDGDIGVESVPDEGSTFWFTARLGDCTERPAAPPGVGRRAAVVDSLAEGRAAGAAALRSLGLTLGDAPDVTLVRLPVDELLRAAVLAAHPPGPGVLYTVNLIDRCEIVHTVLPPETPVVTEPLRLDELRRAVDAARGQASITPEPAPRHREDYGLRVLVAEDNLVNQRVIAHLLKREGCDALVVPNGARAVDLIRDDHFDLVLMDCQMPEMDGFEATRAIRALESGDTAMGRTPIVAMTANAMKGDRERCLECGMDDYLSKPVEIDALRAVLAQLGALAAA